MNLIFKCKTNKDYVMINTLKIRLSSGSTLTIDRDKTIFSIKDGILEMEWRGCYLWAIDDCHIFEAFPNIGDWEEFEELIDDSEKEFEFDCEADEDYVCEILEISGRR